MFNALFLVPFGERVWTNKGFRQSLGDLHNTIDRLWDVTTPPPKA